MEYDIVDDNNWIKFELSLNFKPKMINLCI